jgi:predicted dehydrogenase
MSEHRVLRVAHLGVSNRGLWPLQHCKEGIGFKPAVLCDVSAVALEEACGLTGLNAEAAFTNIDAALDSAAAGRADCVIACVPTVLHVPVAKKAIARGLPILIEKGMAPDWASACDLVRTAESARAKVCVAQNYRYNPAEKTVRRAIVDSSSAGFVGARPHFLQYIQYRVRPLPRTLTYPFASVWDMSCHHFDNLLSWLGPIDRMTAHAWKAEWSAYEHPNNTTAQIEFRSGTQVLYVHTHDAARAMVDVQVHGERGCLRWHDDPAGGGIFFNERPLEQFGSRPSVPVPVEPSAGETDMLADFHAYITQNVEPGISARANLETMAACEMMVRSVTQGRTVTREELNV